LPPADLNVISLLCAIIIAILLFVLLVLLGNSIQKQVWRANRKEVRQLQKLAIEAVSSGDEALFIRFYQAPESLGLSVKAKLDILGKEGKRQSENGGISVAYLTSVEFRTLGQEKTGHDDPNFYDLKGPFFDSEHGLGRETCCPRDGRRGCALIDFLPRKHRGTCTHFLSWTWGYSIKLVQDGLDLWLEQSGLIAENTFLFCCFFVNNQYRILVDGDGSNSDNLEEIFEARLVTIGSMVALLDTWDEPRYLTRVWTIFEQYTAAKLNIEVTMILPTSSCRSLIKELETGADGINRVNNALVSVDSERSEAFSPKDAIKVKGLIEKDIGFEAVNTAVEKSLISWIGTCVQDHFKVLSRITVIRNSLRSSRSSEDDKERLSMIGLVSDGMLDCDEQSQQETADLSPRDRADNQDQVLLRFVNL